MEEFNDQKDYLQRVGELRTGNRNRIEYKNMQRDQLMTVGYDADLIDLDYVFDQGNAQGKDIMPKIEKQQDGTVKETTLVDMKSKQGLAWAAASKMLYNEMYKSDKVDYETFTVNDMIYGPTIKQGPQTMEDFAQWGIETIGNVNYNITDLGYDVYRLKKYHKQNPETAMAFNYLMETYGKLPMFTWNGTKRFFKGMATDPTTYAGLGTIGVGLLGKTFYNTAGKGAMKETLKKLLHPNAVAMYEGALFGAADDYLRQTIAIEGDAQSEYDFGRMGVAAGAGAAFTGAIGVGATAAKNYSPYAVKALRNLLVDQGQKAQLRIDARKKDTGVTLRSGPDFEDMADKGLAAMGKAVGGSKRQLDRVGMFSKAEEALENIKQDKGTGAQFIQQLQNKFSIKPKELYWLGLDKFNNDKKITKEELIQTIKDNYVDIKEIKFTKPPETEQLNRSDAVVFEDLDLAIDRDRSNWEQAAQDYIDVYRTDPNERMSRFMDLEVADLLHKIGFRDAAYYTGFNNTDLMDRNIEFTLDMLTPNDRIDQTNINDFNAARKALREGEMFYTDSTGRNIDISSFIDEFFDDQAMNEYIGGDYVSMMGTHALGYQVYGNRDNGYSLTGPQGEFVDGQIATLEEVSVQATEHARDYGYIPELPEEERLVAQDADAATGQDTAEYGGSAKWERYKLPGGSNYRELVFQIENYKGDPDLEFVKNKFIDMVKEQEAAHKELQDFMLKVEEYSSLPPSEQQQWLTENNLTAETINAKHNELYFKENELRKRNAKELEIYSGQRLMDSSDSRKRVTQLVGSLGRANYSHHGQINQIGHARIDDRVDPAGDKFMYAHEAQTDWGQKGRNNMISPENLARANNMTDLREQAEKAQTSLREQTDIKQRNIMSENNKLTQDTKQLLETFAENFREFIVNRGPKGKGPNLEGSLSVIRAFENISGVDFSGSFINRINDEMAKAPSNFFAVAGRDSKFFDPNATYDDFLEELHSGKYDEETKDRIGSYVDHYDQQFQKVLENSVMKVFNKVNDVNLLRELGIPLPDEFTLGEPVFDFANAMDDSRANYFARSIISGLDNMQRYNLMKDMFNTIYDQDYQNAMVGNQSALDIVAEFRNPADQKFIEKRKAKIDAVPRGPFVEKDQDFMEFTIKQLVRRAVNEDHKYIIMTGPEDQIARWGERMRGPFERRYKDGAVRAGKEVVKQLDKKAKLELVNAEDIGFLTDANSVEDRYGNVLQGGRIVQNPTKTKDKKLLKIPITDEMRESVKRGMPLFELGGMALGGSAILGAQMAGEENQN